MKMKLLLTTSVAMIVSSLAYSQSEKQVRQRIEGTERTTIPAQASGADSKSKQSDSSSDISANDTGAQRPVQLKDKGISSFFGYDSKYFYRSNPLATVGFLKNQAS